MDDKLTPLKWGILGAGAIAKRFCSDVLPLPDHEIGAVGSRDKGKAEAFGEPFRADKAYGSYEELVADPDIDVIYVATPHPFHKEHSLLALNAGKPVLCEKPFTINAGEAQAVVDAARANHVFLMEGMWSRCFPALLKAREVVQSGQIGEARMLQADFGFRAGVNPESRLFNPALGGGGLMDVGVYTVSLASFFFGTPNRITSLANMGSTGVDEEAAMILGYEGGQMALLSTAIRLNTPQIATVVGTDGKVVVDGPWWKPGAITISAKGQEERIAFPVIGGGFQYEAMHVAECLRSGKKESPIMPLDETLSIMKTMDELRNQFGLKYPME